MRARAAVASILASSAVLIGGWQLGSAGTTNEAPAAEGTSASTPAPAVTQAPASTQAPVAPAAAPAAPASATPSTSSAADGTYTGASESTRYGAVQVSVTVSGGVVTDVTALHLTGKDGRSVSISNRAAPILRSEVLAAQSAQVQAVSGATYTSDGYLGSVQSALDQAGL